MNNQLECPTCGMRASLHDRRHYRPTLSDDGRDLRTCRNCGATVELDLDPDAIAA